MLAQLNKFKVWIAATVLGLVAGTPSLILASDWPQFRGAHSNSVATGPQPPVEWSEADNKNIAWKVKLPGRGPSSPIVVDSRVIVTASSGINQDRLHVLCFDTADGSLLWERQFWATGRSLTHPSSANAAPTPASDGKLIFAFYSSNDLVCLDLDGNLKWFRGLAHDYPAAGNDVGMSSSPVISGDSVIVQVECQGDSFATAVDKTTGEPRWKIPRPKDASWSSPVLVPGAGPTEDLVLLQSPKHLTAHRADTGDQVWAYEVACDGISSPAVVDGVIYVASNGITALKPGKTGEPEVLWNSQNLKPGAASVVVKDGRLFVINRAGVLTGAGTDDGKVLFRTRLEGEFWGTPTLVDNRLFAVSQKGKGQVVEISPDGENGEVIGTGQFEGEVQGSPAIADGALYVRSDGHLWKVAKP